jgi:hypothetical protein
LTLDELAEFDGSKRPSPIYLAIKGIIYDVTRGAGCVGEKAASEPSAFQSWPTAPCSFLFLLSREPVLWARRPLPICGQGVCKGAGQVFHRNRGWVFVVVVLVGREGHWHDFMAAFYALTP